VGTRAQSTSDEKYSETNPHSEHPKNVDHSSGGQSGRYIPSLGISAFFIGFKPG
jgi:hypothetical protein